MKLTRVKCVYCGEGPTNGYYLAEVNDAFVKTLLPSKVTQHKVVSADLLHKNPDKAVLFITCDEGAVVLIKLIDRKRLLNLRKARKAKKKS